MPTPIPKVSEIERKWFIVDAEGQVLGRLASRIASILREHKPTFVTHLDVGDHVVVVNAAKVHLTGRQAPRQAISLALRLHRWAARSAGETMLKTHPERVIEWAVQGMLPKTRLGKAMAKKMKVYRGAAHPHQAQRPETLTTKAEAR